MANFLTDGRDALLDALKADVQIAARVKTWFEFGAGLRRRFRMEPADCPLLALSPAGGDALRTCNALTDLSQRLRIEVATDGQDAEPCEELVALVLDRIVACDSTCLGLAGDGVTGLEVEGITWRPVPAAGDARILWSARIDMAIAWKRA